MGLDFITKLTDPYDRHARLYPTLIALLPLLAMLIGVYGVEPKISTAFVALISAFGVFYLLPTIGRELGKRKEDSLFKKWGGKPTTQLLRHNNTHFDKITKKRFHDFLEKNISIKFPTAEEEKANADDADTTYRAAIQWLLGKTREKTKFNLLFKENISFGFRRNCLGVKPIALVITVLCFLLSLSACSALTMNSFNLHAITTASTGIKASLGTSFFMFVLWFGFFTEKTVKTSAFSYADMLLRSCDHLPKKRTPNK